MTWPEVISKLAEVGLDEHAPKLKELGYDSMDAFDADDKAALEKIADELELKSGHKAKFVKKFSTKEKDAFPAMEPAVQQVAVAAPQNIVVNVSGGGGTDNETKVPATWLAGEWDGDGVEHTCCCTSTLEIAAVGADAFDMKLGDRSATFTRMGHTNNFSPAGVAAMDNDCCFPLSCCCGSGIDSGHLKLMIIIDENNVRGGSSLQLQKKEPTDFRNGNADAETGGSPPVADEMER